MKHAFFFIGAIIFPAVVARSAPSVERVVAADLHRVQGPLSPMPTMGVGAGRVAGRVAEGSMLQLWWANFPDNRYRSIGRHLRPCATFPARGEGRRTW